MSPQGKLKPTRVEIITDQSDFARSHTGNWSPNCPKISEREAIRSLKETRIITSEPVSNNDGSESKKPAMIIDLHDFEVYRSPLSSHKRQFELVSLHHLEVPRTKQVCFDGFLRIDNIIRYVQSVPIHDTSIEGYGNSSDPEVVVYIQSTLASQDTEYDIWFRLHKPSSEYRRFHKPFLWIAQLAKHVIDYIEDQKAQSIGLDSFRGRFHQWITRRFSGHVDFQRWHLALRNQVDFRVCVNAYIEYLYRQAVNLPESGQLLEHPLWGDCMAGGLTRIKAEVQVEAHTLTTSEVYGCFKHMYFGAYLRKVNLSPRVKFEQQRRKRELGFPELYLRSVSSNRSNTSPFCQPYGSASVKVGDVIVLDPQTTDKQLWKNSASEWLAYVQSIEILKNRIQRLSVIWMYRPCDTNVFKAKYPFKNELFFSDNCNCDDGDLLSTDVKGFYRMQWSPAMIDPATLFVRQTYITQESTFVSFREEHKTCICKKLETSPLDGLSSGDTVYVEKTVQRQRVLEPVVIQKIDRPSNRVTVRKLGRLHRDYSEVAAEAHRIEIALNELVLTDEYENLDASRIKRRCSVRFVPREQILKGVVPFPYNRDGAGDFWFLSMSITTAGYTKCLSFLNKLPDTFNEGPDLNKKTPKLRGLSIFSGGGSLDRGLEEGGAVQFDAAVDFSPHAIHTQRANSRNQSMRLYCGSVDDFLRLALAGGQHPSITHIGCVDLIAAGSPCPGFSALQQDILSPESLRNASHISTFCSFVDLYRPLYGILENVVNMASTRKGLEDQNVLSQLVACLVSIGYQVNQYIMDAWNYGSAQHRSRVILSIAAPGLIPISPPLHTHSKDYENTAGRSLGKLPNGQRFGDREYYATPFSYVSAGEITSDLPSVANGQVQTCIPFPDHRLSLPLSFRERALLKCIPRQPPGCGYKEAARLGLIPPSLQKKNKETGKAYSRIKEADLVPTITTAISIQDSRNGACVHWSEHRGISVLEARRAQGHPDNEPIIGTPADQYRIVGNGVDRKVSFALGLALRHAAQNNVPFSYSSSRPVKTKKGSYDNPIEVNDDDSDDESTNSVIDVEMPPTPVDTFRQWHPPVAITAPPRGNDISVRHGGSDAFHLLSQLSKITNFPPLPSKLLSRLSLSPMMRARTLDIPLTLPSQLRTERIKRRIEEVEDIASDESLDFPQSRTTKLAKSSPMSRALDHTAGIDHADMSDGAQNVVSRRTRRSDLQVEFVPRYWNRKPEQEYGKE